jgi:RHS repeat-associated protein
VQESDGQGVQTVAYVLGGTELIAQSRSGATQFYLQDGQMSTRLLTDASGGALNRYTYEAFGTIREQSGNAENVYQYTGQQFDGESGLYSLRARYYDPSVGRFGSRDQYPLDVLNTSEISRYVYSAQNSVNLTDPSGYFAEYTQLNSQDKDEQTVALDQTGKTNYSEFTDIFDDTGHVIKENYLKLSSNQRGALGQTELMRANPALEQQKMFSTTRGPRFVDGWDASKQIAYEVKTGSHTLTGKIRTQILKDIELLSDKSFEQVVWQFYKIGDFGGPSAPLEQALRAAGFIVQIFTL